MWFTTLELNQIYSLIKAFNIINQKREEKNRLDEKGFALIHHAVIDNNPVVIDALIASNVNVNVPSRSGAIPLHYATYKNYTDIAKQLLNGGADPNARDRNGMTALHLAASYGNLELVKSYLNAGAEINALDKLGFTAGNLARAGKHKEVFEYLKQKGARPGPGPTKEHRLSLLRDDLLKLQQQLKKLQGALQSVKK